jgi:hypothetical protein
MRRISVLMNTAADDTVSIPSIRSKGSMARSSAVPMSSASSPPASPRASLQNRLCCPASPRAGMRTIFCGSEAAVPRRCAAVLSEDGKRGLGGGFLDHEAEADANVEGYR